MAKRKKVLITGGAGFIGVNLAKHLLKKGYNVAILDNLSRTGSLQNLEHLSKSSNKKNLTFLKDDIRDFRKVQKAVKGRDVIYHLAAQVAVTTSYIDPREDFEVNALGSLNVLEAARLTKQKPTIIYSSTNKVYGQLEDIAVKNGSRRYSCSKYKDGIFESFPLDLHSPYGCSKGTADQYFRDYYRMYGIPTVVFRQSCIYGPRQMGIVDQGWTAYLAAAVHLGKPITIFGDGKQVRDLLHVKDLIKAYELAVKNIKKSAGEIYNIGGGVEHSFSLLEYIAFLEETAGKKIPLVFKNWRPGDQKIYVSNNAKLKNHLNWSPKICHKEGLKELFEWIGENKNLFK